MKKPDGQHSGIIATSRRKIRKSEVYHRRVWEIKADIGFKYEPLINKEKNFLKKMLLKLKMRIEIASEINDLTSSGKLYSNL